MAETTGQPQQIGTCSTCGWPLREGCAHFCSTGSALIQQTFGVPVASKDAEIAQLRSEVKRLRESMWSDETRRLHEENATLRERVAALEKQLDAANLGWA